MSRQSQVPARVVASGGKVTTGVVIIPGCLFSKAKPGDPNPRCQAGQRQRKDGSKGNPWHPHKTQSGSTRTGCWSHGRDVACWTHLSPHMAVAGSTLQGEWDGEVSCVTGTGLCPRLLTKGGELLSSGLTCSYIHIPKPCPVSKGRWELSLCSYPIPCATVTLLYATHPSDVTLCHCSDIPSQAAVTSRSAMTLPCTTQNGPHHSAKAPQSSDNTVTSQHPMTS